MKNTSEHLGGAYVEARNLRARWIADLEQAPRQIDALLQQICDAVAAQELGEEGGADVDTLWNEVDRLRRLLEVAPGVIRRIETVERERQTAFNAAQRVEGGPQARAEYFAVRDAMIEKGRAGFIPSPQELGRIEALAKVAKFAWEGRELVTAFNDLARRQAFSKAATLCFDPVAR